MKKFFTVLLTISSLMFFSCDENDDKKQETCNAATCEVVANATEMTCNDNGECVVKSCEDNSELSDDMKSCVSKSHECSCDPTCKDNEDCVKGEGDKCECREKDKPTTCDPVCEEGKTECECTNDMCTCVPVITPANECGGKNAGDECAEGKTCQIEDESLACKDKPEDLPAPIDDTCKDKSENDGCGENKTCKKGDGDELECKDKPADQNPTEPTQPDEQE